MATAAVIEAEERVNEVHLEGLVGDNSFFPAVVGVMLTLFYFRCVLPFLECHLFFRRTRLC